MKIVIATIKSWNVDGAIKLTKRFKDEHEIMIITKREELTYELLRDVNPRYVFFPHWSWIIPPQIYENFECVVFHMTNLPYGRGGSPLQNLIVRGVENTKISAIKVEEGIDTGDIYLQEDLSLNGSASEIFIRASNIVYERMIPLFLSVEKMISHPQVGEVISFKRRGKKDGEMTSNLEMKQIFDYIRMLDGEGYPPAYIRFGKYRMEFTRASFKGYEINADVKIILDEVEDEKNSYDSGTS